MDCLAIPLRVDDRGQLVRAGRVDVLAGLLQAMFRTPAGTWAPDPEFGLRDSLEGKWNVSLPQRHIDSANRSLQKLGCADFKILSIDRNGADEFGQTSYRVVVTDKHRKKHSFDL